jgi:hypothetical protein
MEAEWVKNLQSEIGCVRSKQGKSGTYRGGGFGELLAFLYR